MCKKYNNQIYKNEDQQKKNISFPQGYSTKSSNAEVFTIGDKTYHPVKRKNKYSLEMHNKFSSNACNTNNSLTSQNLPENNSPQQQFQQPQENLNNTQAVNSAAQMQPSMSSQTPINTPEIQQQFPQTPQTEQYPEPSQQEQYPEPQQLEDTQQMPQQYPEYSQESYYPEYEQPFPEQPST